MLVQYLWRNCDFRHKQWDSDPVHAFWVEAILTEADAYIFPHVSPDVIAESKSLAEDSHAVSRRLTGVERPYCFLVAQDLGSIDPFHVFYPFNNMWNGYSPFEKFSETRIGHLDELRDLELPKEKTA